MQTNSLQVGSTRRGVLRLTPPALAYAASPGMAETTSSTTNKPAQTLRLDPKRIENALSGMVESGRAAGASVLVWKDDREAFFGSAGFADREAGRRFARDTIAQIYSMTKPVTGVALMHLWEQGKFGLDDPLSRYLPDFQSMQVYAGPDAAGSPIWCAA